MATESHAPDDGQRMRAVTRLAAFGTLSGDELGHLAGMAGPPRQLKRGALIRGEETDCANLCLLIDGWAASAISLADGCRQLTMVALPGDMLGMPALAVREPIDGVIAITQVMVLDIPVREVGRLFVDQPRLAAMLFLVSQEERMFEMERLALLGQAKAHARLAALLLRLSERIGQPDGTPADVFPMPLTQQDLGDLIGVSAVHVNALVKNLRQSEIASVVRRVLHIHDRAALTRAAGVARWRRSVPRWLPHEGEHSAS